MRKKFNKMSKLSGALAAVMVFSMAVSGLLAYADEANPRASITFLHGNGPPLKDSSYGKMGDVFKYSDFVVTGYKGTPLIDSGKFPNLGVDDYLDFGSGIRPKMPNYQAEDPDPDSTDMAWPGFSGIDWPGYTFKGWEKADGNMVKRLPFAIPYDDVTYKAIWVGNDTRPFHFTVMHYRDFGSDRFREPSQTDLEDGGKIRKFYERDWFKSANANSPIFTASRKNIPGYRLYDDYKKNSRFRGYGEASGRGSGAISIVEVTYGVIRGSMPNDDLTIFYRYIPDESKFFRVIIKKVTNAAPENGFGASDITPSPIEIAPPRLGALYNVERRFDIGPENVGNVKHYVIDENVPPTVTSEPSDLSGRGIISAEDAGVTVIGSRVMGPMPNQDVTITYTYKLDGDESATIGLFSVNDSDEPATIAQPILLNDLFIGESRKVVIPPIPGYQALPNVTKGNDRTTVKKEIDPLTDALTLTVTPGYQNYGDNNKIVLTYRRNLEDVNYWAKAEFLNGSHGSLSREKLGEEPEYAKPIFFERNQGKRLWEVTGDIHLVPEPHYEFDGWYAANESGEKTGGKLSDDFLIQNSMKLYANFVENPYDWFDLTFSPGSHGTIRGSSAFHIETGGTWRDVTRPMPAADPGYQFVSWVDEWGNEFFDGSSDGIRILGSHAFTAKFAPSYYVDDGLLTMPDIEGQVAEDGSGTLKVSGVNIDRKYVLTDDAGTILEIRTGVNAATFNQLKPCTVYRLYEVKKDAVISDPLEHRNDPDYMPVVMPEAVDPGDASQPARAAIPALGRNYKIEESGDQKMRLVIAPAPPGCAYAILDMEGGVVNASRDEGWVTRPAVGGGVVLDGLSQNQLYVVVAKQSNEEGTAADRLAAGTQVSVMREPSRDQEYAFSLMNGGFIMRIDYADGREPLIFEEDQTVTSAMVRADDRIMINAPRREGGDEHGGGFGYWSVMLGEASLTDKAQRLRTIQMRPGNLILQANYQEPYSASGTLSVDYSPKDGTAALDLSGERLNSLKERLQTASDSDAMRQGGNVNYTVNLKRRPPKATQSDAVKEALVQSVPGSDMATEAVRVPWMLDLSLKRQVGGSNKELPRGGDEAIGVRIYAEIDRGIKSYGSYGIWEVDPGGELHQVVLLEGAEDRELGGVLSFEGKVGSSYVMAYLTAYKVAVADEGNGQDYAAYVTPGTRFNETRLYEELKELTYTDLAEGVDYLFDGLKPAVGSKAYDVSSPVTKNLSLKVKFIKKDDAQWRDAKNRLKAQIDLANALKDNQTTSQSCKESLERVINPAVEAVNRLPRASIEELLQKRDQLEAAIALSSGGCHPDQPNGPDGPDGTNGPDNPNTGAPDSLEPSPAPSKPSHPGVRVGASSTMTLLYGKSFKDYKTYFAGIEGRWEGSGEYWRFVLNGGGQLKDQWMNTAYGDARKTQTYHVNDEGVMDSGWFKDFDGGWYYLEEARGEDYGRLVTGWHYDSKSQKWFYLNKLKGDMATGWLKAGEDWYYLSPDSLKGQPLGSLYTSGLTPDGYRVDETGRWLRQTPG